MGTQTIAVFHRELASEETADQEPEMMLPVVELLQPGAFVDLFFRTKWSSIVEAVQVRQASQKFFRVGHPVNTELQLIDILRIQMDGRLFRRSKAAIGAQVERDWAGGQQLHRKQQRQQPQEPE